VGEEVDKRRNELKKKWTKQKWAEEELGWTRKSKRKNRNQNKNKTGKRTTTATKINKKITKIMILIRRTRPRRTR